MKTPFGRLISLLAVGVLVGGVGAAFAQFGDGGDQGFSADEDPFGGGSAEFGGRSRSAVSDDPFAEDELGVAGHTDAGHSEHADPREAEHQASAIAQPVVWAGGRSEANEAIESALARQLTEFGLEFYETPLEEVVEFLRDEYEIEIQLDTQAMDELGIGPDEPITVEVRNVSLRSALRLMLRDLELTYLITNEVLMITTEEEAEARLAVAVYPVGDLLNEDTGLDDVVEMLVSTVASETWAENGGGEAEVRPLAPGVLVVSQAHAVHEQIVATLTAIRRANQLPQAEAATEDVPGPSRRRSGGGFGGRRGGGGQFAVPAAAE